MSMHAHLHTRKMIFFNFDGKKTEGHTHAHAPSVYCEFLQIYSLQETRDLQMSYVHFLLVSGFFHFILVFNSWIHDEVDEFVVPDFQTPPWLPCLYVKGSLSCCIVLKLVILHWFTKFKHPLNLLLPQYFNPNRLCWSTEPKQWKCVFGNWYAAMFYRLCVCVVFSARMMLEARECWWISGVPSSKPDWSALYQDLMASTHTSTNWVRYIHTFCIYAFVCSRHTCSL